MKYRETLSRSIEAVDLKVGIIGMGYVGLPLSLAFSEKNFTVYGIDINNEKVNKLNSGESYIKHIDSARIRRAIINKTLRGTSNFSVISKLDAIVICVPTPLTKYREPDLSYIKNTLKLIAPYLHKGLLISLESTSYPGTTEEILFSFLTKEGYIIGEDIFLIYSPEREDPGNKTYSTENIPKIVGGITKTCCEIGMLFYNQVVETVVPVRDTKTAEMIKLLENIHRAVNIGLMNELKPLTDKMGIDLYEVIEGAATKPFGFVPYYPGPGLGGHCLPVDPFYLTWKAKEYGMNTKFIELAGEINTSMPKYVIKKTSDALNKVGKPLKDSKILILGISYKKNVDDVRESPALEIIQELIKHGAKVSYSDPYHEVLPKTRNNNYKMKNIEINKENLIQFDIVILVTDHDDFNYETIIEFSNLIIDTRGRLCKSDKIMR